MEQLSDTVGSSYGSSRRVANGQKLCEKSYQATSQTGSAVDFFMKHSGKDGLSLGPNVHMQIVGLAHFGWTSGRRTRQQPLSRLSMSIVDVSLSVSPSNGMLLT
jgi:hypothetical protein